MRSISRTKDHNNSPLGMREFVMTQKNYKEIQSIAYRVTGISLLNHKESMIYGRLARRLRALNLKSFNEYLDLLNQEKSPEEDDFVNAITTNLTSFFRENHHFEYLKNTLVPQLIKKNHESRRIRVWSAGCSTGEEPYSIAMVLKSFPQLRFWDVKVLASDLDSNVVDTSRQGIYSIDRIASIPDEYKKHLEYKKHSEEVRIKDSLRSIIQFNQLNLLHEWPMKRPFDLIFCRNVVIYFDVQTQKKLFDRYAQILKPDGNLFIGHSENLNRVCNRFECLGRTMYRRIK